MIRNNSWALLLVIVSVCIVLSGIPVVAQESRAPDNYYLITGLRPDSTCNDLRVFVFVNNQTPGFFDLKVIYDGEIVTDTWASSVVGTLYAFTSTGYENDRGLAPVNRWPLSPGKKVEVFVTLYDANFEPFFESYAKLKSCDASSIKKLHHGRVYQLLQNPGFEIAARDELFMEIPDVAAYWKGKGTTNDTRTCGSANYIGSCGFLFDVDNANKSKITQTYSGNIGSKGDNLLLLGYADRYLGYDGGGKLIATVTFANGETRTLSVKFPAGALPYTYPYYAFTKLPAPLLSAKVMVKQGFGESQLAVDAVTLSVFTNDDVLPRGLPPAPGTEFINVSAK